MNKRRRYLAKRRRKLRHRRAPAGLRFHPDAFSLVWPMPARMDVLYGTGTMQPGRLIIPSTS